MLNVLKASQRFGFSGRREREQAEGWRIDVHDCGRVSGFGLFENAVGDVTIVTGAEPKHV
jgi:hypothetical protein